MNIPIKTKIIVKVTQEDLDHPLYFIGKVSDIMREKGYQWLIDDYKEDVLSLPNDLVFKVSMNYVNLVF